MTLSIGALSSVRAATPEENKLYKIAQAAFQDKIYDLAERQFSEFLQTFPTSERADSAQLFLGQAQLERGKWREAVKTFQDGLAKWPDKHPEGYRFWLAEALMRGEQFADAGKQYAELLDKFPRGLYRAQAQYGLAYAQFKQGQYEVAADSLEKVAKLGPKPGLALEAELLRGQIYLGLGKYEPAEVMLDGVIKKAGDTRVSYQARIWLGESLARRGKYDEALKQYGVVLEAFAARPNKPVDAQLAAEAWYGAGWTHWLQEQFDAAADAYAKALVNAQSARLKRDALLKLGEAYVRGGKLADGITKLKVFLQDHPADAIADEVQLEIGDLLYGAGDFAAALAEYATLITKYPQSKHLAKTNLNAGWCAWKLNQATEALKYFQQAFELSRDTDPAAAADALFKIGDAQFALGQYADAIGTYQRIIGSYPETKLLDRAMCQLGQAFQRTRNAEAAESAFASLVEQFPASPYAPEAQFQIGLIEIGLGREDQARTAFTTVAERFPGTDWANRAALAIGESYYREGKYDDATAVFDKLIASAPEAELGQRAFYNRGWCDFQRGQPEKTLAAFGEFLQKYPDSSLAPEVQFWIAYHYMQQKDYIKSQEQFQLLAKNYPTSKQADSAQYYAARSAYARQDFKVAIELYDGLLKSFPESSWRCDARFGEGDALTELGQFDNALLVFDALIKEFPDCYLLCEAHGRKGDCQYTLERYADAIASFRSALGCARVTDSSLRNQLCYKIGQSFEKQGKLSEAFEQYSVCVYESAVAPPPDVPPERFWVCKAGLAAAAIKEQQQQWKEAIKLYERLLEVCPDNKALVEERIRVVRVDHFIWF